MKKSEPREQTVDTAVGQKVRQRRVALGVSQEKLGRSLGLTFQQVQKMEKGRNRIGAGRLWQLASLLNVPIEYFYKGLPRFDSLDPNPKDEHNAAARLLGCLEGQKMAEALYDMRPKVRNAVIRLAVTIGEQDK